MAAIDGPGNQQVLWQPAEGELGALVVIGQFAARLAQQLIDRHIACRHAQQVAVQTFAAVGHAALGEDGAHLDPGHVAHAFFVQGFVHGAVVQARDLALQQGFTQRRITRRGPQVDQRCNRHALLMQIQRGQIPVVITGQYHGPLARLDRIEFHQALGGTAQHHPRQVVVAKDHRLIERAAAHQALAGPHLVQAFALNYRQVVVGEPGVTGRLGEHFNIGVLHHLRQQRMAHSVGLDAFNVEAGIGQRATEHRLLLDQQHLGPGIGGRQRGLQTGRPGADHRQIREQVRLVVVLGGEVQIEHTQPGFFANHRLPELPHALGLVERAVVEPHRHEFGKLAQPGVAVMVQAAVDVLRADLQTRRQRAGIGQHVGFFGQLHQAVGVLPGHGQRATGAVVFERTGEQKPAVGQQRTGNAVTLQSLVALAIEGEVQRLMTVDQQAHRGGEAVHPAISLAAVLNSTRRVNSSLGSKVRSTSSLTVWRSAINQ